MLRITGALVALSLLVPCAALAELTTKEARKLMFREKGRSVVVADVPFLGDAERKALEAYAAEFPYYGAMALSPGDPADSGSAVALSNYHSPQDAERAALAACEARRKTGAACVIIATVTPRRYKARDLTLSVEATGVLKGAFRKLEAPKAFAVSPATGAWGFARGDGGRALEQCNAKTGGARDCKIVVADR